MSLAEVKPSDSENQPKQSESGLDKEPSFDKGLMEDIREFAETKASVKAGRDKLNAQLAAALTALVDQGFNKDGIKMAIKYYETSEEKRANFDLSNAFAREALGLPVQGDMLFEASVQRQIKAHSNSEEHF